ncbi:DUF5667 domain-containing protein [Dehalobacter sp.]|uniref:DUF5667 domain-containing protein n=1 Tax=Dehalobacter sp. TaxID=1962289 RepID=UPI00258B8B3F|nr:DUF5667 domain-containing protein [Dehalobacter sp.]MCG1024861.1 hemagglutinin [Dehalobacter sp.]
MIRKKILILVSILCVFLIIAVAPTCVFAETTTDGTTVIEDVSTSTPGTPTEPATDSTAADPTTYTATTDSTTTDTTTTDAVTTDSTITDSTVQASTADEAGVTPDSWLYSLEQMIESVQVAVTFSDAGKVELLVEFANERLAEAEIMSEQNQLDLMEQALKAYSDTIKKANFQVQQMVEDTQAAEGTDTTAIDATGDNESVTTSTDETAVNDTAEEDTAAADTEENTVINNLLASIELLQSDADKVVLKISGNLTEEQAEIMQNIIQAEVQNTIAIKAHVAAKVAYAEAVQEFAAAKAELGQARASGDEAAITAALEKAEQAEQYKNDMQGLRKDVQKIKVATNKETKEVLKEQIQNIKEYKKANKERAVGGREDSLEAGDEQGEMTADNQDVTVADDQNAEADDQSASDEITVEGTNDESDGTVDAQSIQNTVTNTPSSNGHNGKGQGKR